MLHPSFQLKHSQSLMCTTKLNLDQLDLRDHKGLQD